MSRGLVLAVIAVAAGLSAIPASAAPPQAATITSAGTTYHHATATWTLPAGVEPQLIEIASGPSVGSDGSFFEDNREESDLLRPGQKSYIGADELGLGTHWLHLQTVDDNCSSIENSTCIAWSNIVRLTIGLDANSRPALRFVRVDVHLHEAQVTACDETDGRLTFRTTLSVDRFGYGHVSRHRTYSPFTRPTYTEGERNCSPYFVPLPRLNGVGRYTLMMTATDARGGRSKAVVKRFSVRD